jgi:hypothetical protein
VVASVDRCSIRAVHGGDQTGPNPTNGAKRGASASDLRRSRRADRRASDRRESNESQEALALVSPYAPSAFIAQFIRGRHAAAVIGTEVAIWEALATDIASSFLCHFLDGKTAGEALLRARRTLLARNNPLGLVHAPIRQLGSGAQGALTATALP